MSWFCSPLSRTTADCNGSTRQNRTQGGRDGRLATGFGRVGRVWVGRVSCGLLPLREKVADPGESRGRSDEGSLRWSGVGEPAAGPFAAGATPCVFDLSDSGHAGGRL